MKNSDKLLVIGDVHGCFPTLKELLGEVDPNMPLLFLGDLINRGPSSLETLRYVKNMAHRAICLLGNHEMHLLASAAGAGKSHRKDTIQEILQAHRSFLLPEEASGKSGFFVHQ